MDRFPLPDHMSIRNFSSRNTALKYDKLTYEISNFEFHVVTHELIRQISSNINETAQKALKQFPLIAITCNHHDFICTV